MKYRNEKGFTISELLIAVAIIGILVVISVPYINRKLEKAREAHDIAIMRQAAAVALRFCYEGITIENAEKYGLKPYNMHKPEENNACGIYNPKTSKFYLTRKDADKEIDPYGKGTKEDGRTALVIGNDTGAYASTEDYTQAVILVSIYPDASNPHLDVYWKVLDPTKNQYIGGNKKPNIADYSMRLYYGA